MVNDVSFNELVVCLGIKLILLQDDPLVEYEDEFGRVRTARRSEVPRNLIMDQNEQVDEDE